MTENNEVSADQNSGVIRRLAVLSWRSSSIHPSRLVLLWYPLTVVRIWLKRQSYILVFTTA